MAKGQGKEEAAQKASGPLKIQKTTDFAGAGGGSP